MKASFKFLPGMAFGVTQPTMLLRLELGHVTTTELRGLEKWLAYLDGVDELPEHLGGPLRRKFAYRVARGILAVQQAQGIPLLDRVSVVSSTKGAEDSTFQLALPYFFPGTAAIAAQWFTTVLENRDWLREWNAADRSLARCPDYQQLKAELDSAIPDVSRLRLVTAALSLDVPVSDLGFGVYLLGQGCFSQRLDATTTEDTPGISVRIAKNKLQTATILRRAGLPAPRHHPASDLEQAKAVAKELGFPVVVKPWDRDRGEGVAAGLRSEEELTSAFETALKVSPNLLVERHYDGFTHRLTVFRGKVIKVSQRRPGGVSGDGFSTIEALVARAQAAEDMQRRARARRRVLLDLDDEALDMLTAAGLAPDSIPPAGQFIPLRRRDNVSTGGSNTLLSLEAIAPDNIQLAIEAARVMRLDLAGVDLLSRNLGEPWYHNGAIICEVNAQPQLGDGSTPGIYQEILRELLGEQCRIPFNLVITDEPGDECVAQIENLALTLGCNGFSANCQVRVGGLWASGRHRNRFQAAVALLEHTACRSAVCHATATDVLEFGLPVDRLELILLDHRLKRSPELDQLLAMVQPHAGEVRLMDEWR